MGQVARIGTGTALGVASAASYGRVLGANDRINIAFVGLRSRGRALLESAVAVGASGLGVNWLCDVDSRVLTSERAHVESLTGIRPDVVSDFRILLGHKDLDAVVIATPDHTHAPFCILAMQAGKHVYLEKPCSHNPHEGELLVAAASKHGRVVQVGNQQRSAPTTLQAIEEIRSGLIGRPYLGKAWYANTRGSIGRGEHAPVPDWLDWELWQGPAPRREYADNLVHYNWHWFWHWGTGEINNNGLHEIDICRWALDAHLPLRVTSSGGRFHFDDDWEFYDSQVASYEFPNDTMITWEGRSCNGHQFFGRGRGATIHGTEGSLLIDRNGFSHYDLQGDLVNRIDERVASETIDLKGGGALVNYHLENFFRAIRHGDTIRSPVLEGHISTLLCHLGNISQRFGRTLEVDPKNGHIQNDEAVMRMWRRDYAPGWEPSV